MNLRKTNFFINILIIVAQIAFFSEKATFQIIIGKNCKNTTVKMPETRAKVFFCLKEPTIWVKSQPVSILGKKPAS